MKKNFYVLLCVALLLAACLPSQEQIDTLVKSAEQTAIAQITVVPGATQDIDLIVQATFQSLTLTAQASQQNVPAGNTGSISGELSYPSEFIPALLVVAFDINSDLYYWVLTTENQQTYQIDNIPPGIYHVVSYLLPDGLFVGAYDHAYLCGLAGECTNNTLVDVSVQAGVVTQNINPGNWYSHAADYPLMPMIDGVNIPNTPAPVTTGFVAGQLSYPSNFIPALTIVAFDVNSANYYFTNTSENQSTYTIQVPPGTYYVVAYNQDGSLLAGYSQAVICGLLAECTDHSLIPVNVILGQTTNQVNPQDWYAPPGSFPAKP